MQIQITMRHAELTPEIKEFVERRLAKLEKLTHKPVEVHVVLSQEKFRYVTEAALAAGRTNLRCKAESHDPLLSVDQAVDKLDRQFRKTLARVRSAKTNRRAE